MEKKALTIKMDADDMLAVNAVKRHMQLNTDTNAIRTAIRQFMPDQKQIGQLEAALEAAHARIEMLESGISEIDRHNVWLATVAGEYRGRGE
jgi:hypothetical protein